MREPTYKNEGDVKKQVKKLLNQHNYFWWMPSANGFGTTGVSDFLAFRGGVLLAIETKFDTNKPTTMQRAFLNSIRAETGFAFVVNEKRVTTLESFLGAFDRASKAASGGAKATPEDGAIMFNAIAEMTKEI